MENSEFTAIKTALTNEAATALTGKVVHHITFGDCLVKNVYLTSGLNIALELQTETLEIKKVVLDPKYFEYDESYSDSMIDIYNRFVEAYNATLAEGYVRGVKTSWLSQVV